MPFKFSLCYTLPETTEITDLHILTKQKCHSRSIAPNSIIGQIKQYV